MGLDSLNPPPPPPTPDSATPLQSNQATPRASTITPHFPLPSAHDTAQRKIYALADEGRTPREIAQTLNASPGEVELILNLRAQSKT